MAISATIFFSKIEKMQQKQQILQLSDNKFIISTPVAFQIISNNKNIKLYMEMNYCRLLPNEEKANNRQRLYFYWQLIYRLIDNVLIIAGETVNCRWISNKSGILIFFEYFSIALLVIGARRFVVAIVYCYW